LAHDNFEREDDNELEGYAPEYWLANAIQHSNMIHLLNLAAEDLAKAIESDPAGRKHLRIAEPFLATEFDKGATDERGRKFLILPSIVELPTVTTLDYILGLNDCVEFLGCRIGIGITTKESLSSIGKKLRKKRELANVYSKLGFDKIVILVATSTFDPKVLESELKTVKNSDACDSVHIVEIEPRL
jgi:hypothetical protein